MVHTYKHNNTNVSANQTNQTKTPNFFFFEKKNNFLNIFF